MTEFKDYFSSGSDSYKRFRPLYPQALYDYLASISPSQKEAWDVGCGNGQAALELSKRFQQVHASDASAEQINQAQPAENLTYHVSPAESIEADDNSLDLITVAQAIHWFDHPRFFNEVNRTLKPGGVLAAWGYQLLYTDTELDPIIEHFHSEIVGPYWPKERALLDNSYSKISFPYPRLTPPEFFMEASWEFGHLLGYLNTWSAVKQYEKNLGHNPVEEEFETLKSGWGDTKQSKAIFWPLILYIGKKRSKQPNQVNTQSGLLTL